MNTSAKHISRGEAVKLIFKHKGEIFGAEFERVYPKCTKCHKAYSQKKAVKNNMHCPQCGAFLSRTRKLQGRLGVRNPGRGITPPGSGHPDVLGGFRNRMKTYSMVTVFDISGQARDRTDNRKGGYRNIKITNIKRLNIGGQRYIVDEPEGEL